MINRTCLKKRRAKKNRQTQWRTSTGSEVGGAQLSGACRQVVLDGCGTESWVGRGLARLSLRGEKTTSYWDEFPFRSRTRARRQDWALLSALHNTLGKLHWTRSCEPEDNFLSLRCKMYEHTVREAKRNDESFSFSVGTLQHQGFENMGLLARHGHIEKLQSHECFLFP